MLARNGSETVNVDDGPSFSHAKRRPYVPYDYQGSSSCTLEDAAASLRSSEPDHTGMLLLQDILLKKKITGVRASVFTTEISQLQSILRLHGFSYLPDTVRQCKIVILQHLLNGDCMRYDHLCHSTGNTPRPDRTACRALSSGFSDAPDFVETLFNIVVAATALEIGTDDLLAMVESIGQAKLDRPRKNFWRQLLQSLKTHCARTHHRSMGSAPGYDIFHDLLYGFEQCNTATLVSIMGRHRIIPPHTKFK